MDTALFTAAGFAAFHKPVGGLWRLGRVVTQDLHFRKKYWRDNNWTDLRNTIAPHTATGNNAGANIALLARNPAYTALPQNEQDAIVRFMLTTRAPMRDPATGAIRRNALGAIIRRNPAYVPP